jgi:hypothetical protein
VYFSLYILLTYSMVLSSYSPALRIQMLACVILYLLSCCRCQTHTCEVIAAAVDPGDITTDFRLLNTPKGRGSSIEVLLSEQHHIGESLVDQKAVLQMPM